MLHPRIPITDDRGRAFTLCTRPQRHGSDATFAAKPSLFSQRPYLRAAHTGALSYFLVPLLFFLALCIAFFNHSRSMQFVMGGAQLVTLIAIALAQRSSMQRLHRDTSRASLLSRSLCPSCGYHLAGLTAEEDGCTVCPECSAAWRLRK